MEFNSCASLVDEKIYAEAEQAYDLMLKTGENPTQQMFDLQLKLQQELAEKLPQYNVDPSQFETMGEILDHLQRQDDSIADETRELYLSLGEMSKGDKEASAIFKPWKARHDDARNKKWVDVSNEDQLEVLFEMIDQVHFIMNKMIGLKMDAKDMFILYYIKQKENMRRYNSGY